jgi:hypothetical protein
MEFSLVRLLSQFNLDNTKSRGRKASWEILLQLIVWSGWKIGTLFAWKHFMSENILFCDNKTP